MATTVQLLLDKEWSGRTKFSKPQAIGRDTNQLSLGGELRAVNRIENRIAEAEKLGFQTIYVSKYNKNLDSQKTTIKVKAFGLLPDVFGDLFG